MLVNKLANEPLDRGIKLFYIRHGPRVFNRFLSVEKSASWTPLNKSLKCRGLVKTAPYQKSSLKIERGGGIKKWI